MKTSKMVKVSDAYIRYTSRSHAAFSDRAPSVLHFTASNILRVISHTGTDIFQTQFYEISLLVVLRPARVQDGTRRLSSLTRSEDGNLLLSMFRSVFRILVPPNIIPSPRIAAGGIFTTGELKTIPHPSKVAKIMQLFFSAIKMAASRQTTGGKSNSIPEEYREKA
jgi:hypothetical protein